MSYRKKDELFNNKLTNHSSPFANGVAHFSPAAGKS